MLHLLCSYKLPSFSLSSALLDEWHAKFPKGTANITLSCEEDHLWPRISLTLLLWLDCQQCAKKSRLQEVNLDVDNSFVSWWKIVHFDPQERLEYEGQPVPVSLDRILFFFSKPSYQKRLECFSFPLLLLTSTALRFSMQPPISLFFLGQYEGADHTLQDKPGSGCSGWSSPLVFTIFLSD